MAILVGAAWLRFRALDIRPLHFDEGVNGWWVDEMMRLGYYPFDHGFYHGPLFFYMMYVSEALFGFNVTGLRLPAALCSLGLVALALAFGRFTGAAIARFAAAGIAVSPAFVFYGRYAIHESLMALSIAVFCWGCMETLGWGSRGGCPCRRATRGMLVAATGLAGMMLTKETYIVHTTAVVAAFVCLRFWERNVLARFLPWILHTGQRREWRLAWPRWPTGAAAALIVGGSVVVFYSGFFLHWEGVSRFFLAVGEWMEIGVGESQSGHVKPAWYWVETLAAMEWPTLVGLVCCPLAAVTACRTPVRWMAIFGPGVLFAYSVIPYKTPWCMVSIIWPLLFVAPTMVLHRGLALPWCRALPVGYALLLAASAWTAWQISFVRPTDDTVPYVYVQTYEDVDQLAGPLKRKLEMSFENRTLRGGIVAADYYPLPWMLREFVNVGYFGQKNGEEIALPRRNPPWDFVFAVPPRVEEVEMLLDEPYFRERLHLRSAQQPGWVYFRWKTFRDLFPGREPEFLPAPAPVPHEEGDE